MDRFFKIEYDMGDGIQCDNSENHIRKKDKYVAERTPLSFTNN